MLYNQGYLFNQELLSKKATTGPRILQLEKEYQTMIATKTMLVVSGPLSGKSLKEEQAPKKVEESAIKNAETNIEKSQTAKRKAALPTKGGNAREKKRWTTDTNIKEEKNKSETTEGRSKKYYSDRGFCFIVNTIYFVRVVVWGVHQSPHHRSDHSRSHYYPSSSESNRIAVSLARKALYFAIGILEDR